MNNQFVFPQMHTLAIVLHMVGDNPDVADTLNMIAKGSALDGLAPEDMQTLLAVLVKRPFT